MYNRTITILLALFLIQSGSLIAQETKDATIIDLQNITFVGTTVTKTSAADWGAGGISEEILGVATDGFTEMTIDQVGPFRVFGLSKMGATAPSTNVATSSTNYGIYINGGLIYILEDGSQSSATGKNYIIGDKLRVTRKGAVISYERYRIETGDTEPTVEPLYTSLVKTLDALYVDFTIKSQNSTISEIRVSNDFYKSADNPYPGPTTDPIWTNESEIEFRGNRIVKTSGTSGFGTAGATSVHTLGLATAGSVRAEVYEDFSHKVFGLSQVSSGHDVDQFDYAIYLTFNKKIYISENSVEIYEATMTYDKGDIFEVERTSSGEIKYWHINPNDPNDRTDLYPGRPTPVNSVSSLVAEIAFNQIGSTLANVTLSNSFANPNVPVPSQQSLDWTDIEGIGFAGDKIIKTAPTQWGNAGAASVELLKPGVAGWVEMTVSQLNTARTLGLSETNLDASTASIDFAIQLNAIGEVRVIESGVIKNMHPSSYSINDVYRIERDEYGVITYSVTNATGTTPINGPGTVSNTQLIVDIALKDFEATISNVQTSDSFEYPSYAGGGHWNKNGNTVYSLDNIAIGRDAAVDGFFLSVQGKIRAQGVRVTLAGWADFVFKSGYDLKSLEYVKQFIEENGHLPDVPSEAEVLKNGIELEKMDATLLRKIEELTLYLIKQNEQLAEQNKKLLDQNKKIEQMEKELKEIKKGK